jgi:serralysin
VRGGAGNDEVIGGFGSDRLYGGAGNDILRGLGAADLLNCGPGDDTAYARPQDHLVGCEHVRRP